MNLLDVNFTMFGPDRQNDREGLYDFASQIGEIAWASETQFYLLTSLDAIEAHNQIRYVMWDTDFLKVQSVMGPFALTGVYPPRVNELLEKADSLGVISLNWSKDASRDLLLKLLGR